MENFREYLKEVLGVSITLIPVNKPETDRLPFYIKESFRFSKAELFNQSVIFAESLPDLAFTSLQYGKMLELVKNINGKEVILVLDQLSSLERKRLIQRRINFIVPGTQLFLPSLLIDLQEKYKPKQEKSGKLLPSAQFIILYRILHGEIMETLPLKALAKKLGYTPMGISKSVENLKKLNLCTTEGTKEKYIRFNKNIQTIWHTAQSFLSSPVLKKIFADELPANNLLLKSNESALPEYTDMAEAGQVYLAMEKGDYYALQKKGRLKNENESEGIYCIEVWKYDPAILANGISKEGNVDPLSLFLSLKETMDERIESAREQIIENYIVKWSGE